MLLNPGTDENERSVVAASESNQTIVAYLPERFVSARNLQLAINQNVFAEFESCRWSKTWWNPFNGRPKPVQKAEITKLPRNCESGETTPCYTFQFNAPLCTGTDSRSNDRCDWVLLLSDLLTCPSTPSSQTHLWSGLDDSTGQWGVFAQQHFSTGEAAGPITVVGDLSSSIQAVPRVAGGGGPGALVVWIAEDLDGEGFGIVARKLDGAGLPVGDVVRVSDLSIGDQVAPTVAAVGGAGYVVAWTSYSEEGDKGEIYARYLDGNGHPLAPQFRVNVTTAGQQGHPQLASDASGNVLIAWESWGQDGDGNGVFARRFDAAHTGSDEFQVYEAGAGWQYLTGVVATPDGGFEVSWQVHTPHGHDLGTWGQRVNTVGRARSGDEFSVAGPDGGV